MKIERYLFTFIFFLLSLPQLSSKELKVLRWAADAESNAPYIFQDPKIPTNIIGFEVDIVNAIAEILNVETKFVQNQWDGLIPGLYRGDYDIAINGLEITEDRKKEVNFTNPYYITHEQLVVLRGVNYINSLSDLVGRKVGALKNSLAERILRAKGGINVLTYEGEVNAFVDMKNGRIEAVLVDAPIAIYYTAVNPEFVMVGQPIGEISYGIALRKQDTFLLNKLNWAIDKLRKTGKLREILESWNLWNFMMETYFDDFTPSNVPPRKYQYFVEAVGKKSEIAERINLYIKFLPVFFQAALITLGLSLLAMLLAIFVGLIIALARIYGGKIISSLAVTYIETIRGTPLLIQLYLIFYALPSIGIKLSPFLAAILGLGLNYAAYEAEVYRSGFFAIPRGQMEAAISLGMTKFQAIWHIILPQAIRIVIPPVTNDFISLLKDSSLVSVITMIELTKVYNQIASTYYDYLGTGIITAILYLLLGLPFIRIARYFERRLAIERKGNQNINGKVV
ncbi:MAG: ABC transporter substrate-binding protein/permease [Ignavibacteria bacterium]|nr:ABC transporter substrate-binding protein/permease [Ignavibacteria bacterium]